MSLLAVTQLVTPGMVCCPPPPPLSNIVVRRIRPDAFISGLKSCFWHVCSHICGLQVKKVLPTVGSTFTLLTMDLFCLEATDGRKGMFKPAFEIGYEHVWSSPAREIGPNALGVRRGLWSGQLPCSALPQFPLGGAPVSSCFFWGLEARICCCFFFFARHTSQSCMRRHLLY